MPRFGFLLVLGGGNPLRIALGLSAGGAGASLFLLWRLTGGSIAFCPVCVLAHVANLGLLVSIMAAVRRSACGARGAKALIPIAVALMAAGVALEASLFQTGPDPERVVAEYEALPRVEIPISASDPRLGATDGPVRMVVFSSFQCPGCQMFAGLAHRLAEDYGRRLTIVFKNYPLGQKCNPALAADLQPRACAAARASVAARLQGAFWAYHDGLFASELRASEETLREIARTCSINLAQWESDRNSDRVRVAVARDVALGRQLGVDATPAVFLNGRRIRNLSPAILRLLVEHEGRS